MKVKKVKLITEEARNVDGISFVNSTQDQFPYVEAALNSLDNNFNWWKDNWQGLEQMISQNLTKSLKNNMSNEEVSVTSRFTVFHGTDEKVKDVIWTGPAIVYTFDGAGPSIVRDIKNDFGGMYKGRKIFADGNQLIFLFG